MERSLLLFESSIKSKYTLEEYLYNLKTFLKFTKVKDYDTLANLDSDTIQKFLEDYVLTLRERGLSHSTMKSYLAASELFFELNKKVIHKKILHKMIPAREKGGSDKPYTTEDIQKMLQSTTSKRDRMLIHFLASTGARPRSIEDPVLVFKNVHDMPDGCKAMLLYAGSREEYWAFLTPEASRALNDYVDERKSKGEIITEGSPVFANKIRVNGQKVTHMQFGTAHVKIYLLLKKAGIEGTKNGTRFDKAISYGFRKRFNTVLKTNNQVNSNIAEKLMAHKNGLDGSYLKPTREQCFNEFAKAIPDLTVDDSERHKVKIRNLEQEKSEIEKNRQEIEEVKKKLEEVKFGPEARDAAFAKNMLDATLKDDKMKKILAILSYVLFEMRAKEEEKREVLKKLEQAKENGEEFDFMSWFGEPKSFSLENLFGRPVTVQ